MIFHESFVLKIPVSYTFDWCINLNTLQSLKVYTSIIIYCRLSIGVTFQDGLSQKDLTSSIIDRKQRYTQVQANCKSDKGYEYEVSDNTKIIFCFVEYN